MKRSNRLLLIIIAFTTLVVSYALPPLVRQATISNDKYPFVYYSSQLHDLCLIDYSDKQTPMEDLSGVKYTTAEFDTLLPLLNFRQLMSDGLLPDSIGGISAEPRNLMMHSVVMRYDPKERIKPRTGLYALLESMPTRVGLTQPSDMFRIGDKIEFLDAESNEVDQAKSDRFQTELLKRGYHFPTQWVVGDANTRKSFDEGYFCLDAEGELFHLKMVNSRPFAKNTKAADEIDVAHFGTYNSATRRFYGYMLSQQGELYILESDDHGGYRPLKLDIGVIDIEREKVQVMGNILYWTVTVTAAEGRRYYALRAEDLSCVATHSIARERNGWDYASEYLMPFTLSFEAPNSEYIYPRFNFAGLKSIYVSVALALLWLYLYRRERLCLRLLSSLFIAVSGIAGLIALLILPKFQQTNK